MSEVKRLEMDHKGLPFVDDNGVYVLYEDYANLKEQFNFKQNLTEQVVALQKQCDALALLAELVPPEMTWQDSNNMTEVAGFNECRDIILRNIEEAKK